MGYSSIFYIFRLTSDVLWGLGSRLCIFCIDTPQDRGFRILVTNCPLMKCNFAYLIVSLVRLIFCLCSSDNGLPRCGCLFPSMLFFLRIFSLCSSVMGLSLNLLTKVSLIICLYSPVCFCPSQLGFLVPFFRSYFKWHDLQAQRRARFQILFSSIWVLVLCHTCFISLV